MLRPADCIELPGYNVSGNSSGNMSDNVTRNVTCIVSARWFDTSKDRTCEPPDLAECPVLNFLINQADYRVERKGPDGFPNYGGQGATIDVSCAAHTTPIDGHFPLQTWGHDKSYEGTTYLNSTCNNGSWSVFRILGGYAETTGLNCVTREQVGLLQDMDHLLQYTSKELSKANAVSYKWNDANAMLRRSSLVHAQEHALRMINAAIAKGEVASASDMRIVLDAMTSNRVIPRGEPYTMDVCKDLEQHFLYQLNPGATQINGLGLPNYVPPVNETSGYPRLQDLPLQKAMRFECSYAVQKRQTGFDWWSRQPTYFFREGCQCESGWTGGCPFRNTLSPSFKYFGFDSMDEKGVSRSRSAPTNAFCWYWSNALHPEWGYLRNGHGYAYQAPELNSTDLTIAWMKKQEAANRAYLAAGGGA